MRKAVTALLALALACSSSSTRLTSASGGGGGANGGATTTTGSAGAGPCGGSSCAVDEQCCASACVATSACTFAVTSVAPAVGWLNGDTWIELQGAGFSKGMKVEVGGGRAPARVIDASHAVALTPPGPAGSADVAIAAGANTATLRSAFRYEPAGITKQWIEVVMSSARGEEPALALLRDGRVLIAGGSQKEDFPNTAQATAELFDRPSEKFASAQNDMSAGRWWDSAVTLLTGKVLVVGDACNYGSPPAPAPAYCADDATVRKADLFDPATNTFTPTAMALNKERGRTLAQLLPDGRVIIASAGEPSVEIYDPDADSFQLVPAAHTHDFGFSTRLRDGRVLFGGGNDSTNNGALTTAVEAFDADTNALSEVGALSHTRFIPAAVALPDGSALVIGGDPQGNVIDRFDPAKNSFSPAPYSLAVGRSEEAAVLLGDGTVLAVGGLLANAGCTTTTSVEQIDPVAGTVSKFPDRPSSSTELSGLTLADGSVLVAGGVQCKPGSGGPNSNFVEFLAGQPPIK